MREKSKQFTTLQIINILILFTFISILTININAQDKNFYIYLCFGQSNMEGQGTIEAKDRLVSDRFQVLQSLTCSNLSRTETNWYKAVPPLCQCWSGLSPADYFGRTMVENLPDSIKIGVINVAVGGCDIRLFDKDLYHDYDSTYTESWFTDKIEAYNGNPYKHLMDLAKQAKEDGIIKGILLHQGETNTGNSQWPNYVKKIYNDMLTDLSLEAESVPLLAGEVVHADQGGICASMNTIINKLPETIPTAYVISSSGCSDKSDNIHFNSEGYRVLGTRYAEKMLTLMGITPTSVNEANNISTSFELKQNYPNPFNPTTVISYNLSTNSEVEITIYDTLGNKIKTLVNETKPAGSYSIKFDASDLASGIYLYKLKAGNFVASKKMVFLK